MNRAPTTRVPKSSPARASAPPSRRTVLWGVVLLIGGLAIWHALAGDAEVPEVWRTTSGVDGPTTGMESIVRAGGSPGGDLLRLEWPAHPRASRYHVRFRGTLGGEPPPVPVRGTIFLYDLGSNVLSLPDEFEWDVAATLADGSEVVTPLRRVALGD